MSRSGTRVGYTKYDVSAIYDHIQKNPGISPLDLRRFCNSKNHCVEAILYVLEKRGLLVYEDSYGNIYAYEEEKERV